MRYIIGILIILEIIYQVNSQSTSVNWSVFFDSFHYGGIMLVCLYYYVIEKDKLIFTFSLFWAYKVAVVLNQIGLDRVDYLEQIRQIKPVYNVSIFITFILIIFTLIMIKQSHGRKNKR